MRKFLLSFLPALCFLLQGFQAAEHIEPNRLLTVRDGLPQSFVSGMFQDDNGFLWVSTLNGLGRYDGRSFKNYVHLPSDTSGISSNIILYLFDAGNKELWLCYMDGRIDQFNTVTGNVVHLWKNKHFVRLKNESGNFKTLLRNNKGSAWMMAGDGGIFEIDLQKKTTVHLSPADLHLQEKVLGMAVRNEKLLLLTKTRLVSCNENTRVNTSIPYPFKSISQAVPGISYSPGVRANGDLLLSDASGIKIWNPERSFFKQVSFRRSTPGKSKAAFDHRGNYFFENDTAICLLRPDNSFTGWSAINRSVKGIPTSLFIDRSGVMWVGTNGFGMRQYNLFKTGLPGYESQYSFVRDVLAHTNTLPSAISKTFLANSVPFANRSATQNDSVWITDIHQYRTEPRLALFHNNQINEKIFRSAGGGSAKEIQEITFLATGAYGHLWGINQRFQPVLFDKQQMRYHLSPAINTDANEDVNGMVTNDNRIFYISTTKNLYYYNRLTGLTQKLTGSLPSNDLLHICNDPEDNSVLWIGTLSDGLIRFDKHTRKTQLFSTATGLPNNTIYGIVAGNDGLLWCSSNKGIFAFNKRSQTARSFTSRDGLTDDEFNRHYYMVLPGGELAFGGPAGYTIFNPSKLESDAFDPAVVITDLSINNEPYRQEPASEVKALHLRHNQNFINVVFTALQFDFPEKIQYRYMLEGLDHNWIITGNDNKAAYTSLPPGNYTLLLSATNTAGKWSTHTASVKIFIAQPFWNTWWFYLGAGVFVFLLLYLFVKTRIRSIQKTQAQKMMFERKAMELHALALRAQMNPHFIFNCLNSIKALIQEKQSQNAVSYLTTFSVLIRRQLSNKSNEISLHDELETCRLYLELEAMRFGDHLRYSITPYEDEELGHTKVPPLILQPIVENAIIHGLLPSEKGGMINVSVYREGDYCVCAIKDNGIGRAGAQLNKQKSTQLHRSEGLHLLEERIAVNSRINGHINSLETIDLSDPEGKAAGTLVIIKFYIDV
jgi:ligand-binding sensor domain-containing protein